MERTQQIIAWELLFILVFASLLIIENAENLGAITGSAVAGVTRESLLTEVEQLVKNLNFLKDVNDAALCIIINVDSSTSYSYEVVKVGNAIAITTSESQMCKGADNEDFIISYPTYEKFRQHVDKAPAYSELKKTSDGTNFYVYPSRYVLSGFKLTNNAEFDEKFGKFLRKYYNAAEVQMILNPDSAVAQKPAFISYLFYFIIGLVAVVIIITVLVLIKQKKPEVAEDLELTAYIKSALSQGYSSEQVAELLISNGWDQEKVQKVLSSINQEAPEFGAAP